MKADIEQIFKEYKNKKEDTFIMNVMNLNMGLLEQIQTQKAKSKLKRLTAGKIVTIIIGILWILLLGALVLGNNFRNMYFGISMSAILLVNVLVVILYIQQVILIQRINYSSSIVQAQQKLSKLQLSTLTIARIAFLQTPFWTTFIWSSSWVSITDWHFLLIAVPVTGAFTFATAWLFRNIRIENKDKKWFGYLFRGPSWDPIVEAQAFLADIEEFKKE